MPDPTIHIAQRMGEVIEGIESRRGRIYAHLAAQLVGARILAVELHAAAHSGAPESMLCTLAAVIDHNLGRAIVTAGVDPGDISSLVQAHEADRDDLIQQLRAAAAGAHAAPQPRPTPPPKEASDGEGSTPD